MAGHDLPKRVADAMAAQIGTDALMRELLMELGDIEYPEVYDVGVHRYLVVWPGWTPLAKLTDHVKLSRPRS